MDAYACALTVVWVYVCGCMYRNKNAMWEELTFDVGLELCAYDKRACM